MTEIVVLAEEPSGRIIAEHLADKLDLRERTLCLEHQGKGDLERSLSRKIENWRRPRPPRFIVMRDHDGADCLVVKHNMLALAPDRAATRVKIRLVVQELESWYFGDLGAVARTGLLTERELLQHRRKARYRDPDAIRNAKRKFKSKIAAAGQIELARRIGPLLSVTENTSHSFHAFVAALRSAANVHIAP